MRNVGSLGMHISFERTECYGTPQGVGGEACLHPQATNEKVHAGLRLW